MCKPCVGLTRKATSRQQQRNPGEAGHVAQHQEELVSLPGGMDSEAAPRAKPWREDIVSQVLKGSFPLKDKALFPFPALVLAHSFTHFLL